MTLFDYAKYGDELGGLADDGDGYDSYNAELNQVMTKILGEINTNVKSLTGSHTKALEKIKGIIDIVGNIPKKDISELETLKNECLEERKNIASLQSEYAKLKRQHEDSKGTDDDEDKKLVEQLTTELSSLKEQLQKLKNGNWINNIIIRYRSKISQNNNEITSLRHELKNAGEDQALQEQISEKISNLENENAQVQKKIKTMRPRNSVVDQLGKLFTRTSSRTTNTTDNVQELFQDARSLIAGLKKDFETARNVYEAQEEKIQEELTNITEEIKQYRLFINEIIQTFSEVKVPGDNEELMNAIDQLKTMIDNVKQENKADVEKFNSIKTSPITSDFDTSYEGDNNKASDSDTSYKDDNNIASHPDTSYEADHNIASDSDTSYEDDNNIASPKIAMSYEIDRQINEIIKNLNAKISHEAEENGKISGGALEVLKKFASIYVYDRFHRFQQHTSFDVVKEAWNSTGIDIEDYMTKYRVIETDNIHISILKAFLITELILLDTTTDNGTFDTIFPTEVKENDALLLVASLIFETVSYYDKLGSEIFKIIYTDEPNREAMETKLRLMASTSIYDIVWKEITKTNDENGIIQENVEENLSRMGLVRKERIYSLEGLKGKSGDDRLKKSIEVVRDHKTRSLVKDSSFNLYPNMIYPEIEHDKISYEMMFAELIERLTREQTGGNRTRRKRKNKRSLRKKKQSRGSKRRRTRHFSKRVPRKN